MTKNRKRLKRRIRQLEHRLEQCYEQKRRKHPFDEHLSAFEREMSDLGPEVVGGEVRNAYRLLIYFELINYARSIHVLTIHGTQSNAPYLLLRGMLEGLADLKNLCRSDSALEDMYMK